MLPSVHQTDGNAPAAIRAFPIVSFDALDQRGHFHKVWPGARDQNEF